jgi:hypothetical protein
VRFCVRVPAAVLAAMWLLSPLVSAVHGALAEHRYCARHGSFEEVGASSRAERWADDGPARVTVAFAGEHHACAFGDVIPCGAARLAPPSGQAPPCAGATPPVIASIDLSPIPILAFAPKSSPPVLA